MNNEYIPYFLTDENGTIRFYKGNDLHREDGPAVIWNDGIEEWWLDGLMHRDGGPAYNVGGAKIWMSRGKMHRTDGPAVITPMGNKWFLFGVEYNCLEWLLKIHEMEKNANRS